MVGIPRLCLLLVLAAASPGRAAAPAPVTSADLVRESATLLAAGQMTMATAKYTAAVAASGENNLEVRQRLLAQRVLTFWVMNRPDLAEADLAAMAKQAPGSPAPDALRAFLLMEKGDLAGARKLMPAKVDDEPIANRVQVLLILRDPSGDHETFLRLLLDVLPDPPGGRLPDGPGHGGMGGA